MLETSKTPELESFLSVPYEFLPLASAESSWVTLSLVNNVDSINGEERLRRGSLLVTLSLVSTLNRSTK